MNHYLSGLLNYYFGISCSIPFSFFGCFGCYGLVRLSYPYFLRGKTSQQRQQFISLLTTADIHHTVVFGKLGKGKTLLLSLIARDLPGPNYTSFPTTDDNIKQLVWGNLDLDSPDHYLLPSHSNLFFDEIGTFGNWSDPKNAVKQFPGVSKYLKFIRHFQHRCFFANQRLGGGVGIEIRALADLFIETLGLTNYGSFHVLRFKTASSEEMLNPRIGRILITNEDFKIYQSRGMEPLVRIKNEGLTRTDPKLVPAFLTTAPKLPKESI